MVTTPVARPALSASVSQLSRSLLPSGVHSPLRPADTPMAPMCDFTPVAIAVMVPAESGVCESVL